MDFLISQIVKEHAGLITGLSADKKSEANNRERPLDYDFFNTVQLLIQSNNGGAEEDRTPDLLRARQALSQLSYGPLSANRITVHGTLPATPKGGEQYSGGSGPI